MNISWPLENLSNKHLIIIPLLLAAIFGSVVAYNWQSTGNPVPLSLEFAGGSYIRIDGVGQLSDVEVNEISVAFQSEFNSDPPDVRAVDDSIEIETSVDLITANENQIAETRIRDLLAGAGVEGDLDIRITSMGSIITELYKNQARNAAIAALVVMAVILFIALRNYVTVGGILLVVGLDFVGILGGMTLLNIPLSLASMAGILLIFGYAVNTNILLSTNIVKRKGGTARERASRAMSTGIKMSTTSAAAMIVLNIATTAPELDQISAVLAIGILVDMVNTWLLNSGLILRSYEEEGGGKYHARI